MNKTLKISFSLKYIPCQRCPVFLKADTARKAAASGNAVSGKGAENLCKHFVRAVGNRFCIPRQVPLLYHDGMRYRYPL